jgi:hypothetical protein
MFALVESGSITKMMKGNRGITIGDNQYPSAIFGAAWTESERNAIGVYTVEIDNTNKKDENWYINTDITYTFSGGKVKGTYGTATAKAIADANAKDDNGDDLDPVVVIKGLKTIKKEMIDSQCAGILAPSDWMYVKAGEEGVSMDSGWKTWRASVRTKCNSMQTQIDNAANVDALAALFTYTEQEDKSITRPLGEFPVKE